MTKSFGNRGRKPEGPGSQPPGARGSPPEPTQPPPRLRPSPDSLKSDLPSWQSGVRRPTQPQRHFQGAEEGYPDQEDQPQSHEPLEPVKIEPGKRVAALLIDVTAAYLISMIISLVTGTLSYFHLNINQMVPPQIVILVCLLSRDFWYGGRGVGKNLMGLQVVDARTGDSPAPLQSVLRNVILLAPFLAIQIIPPVLKFIPIPGVNGAITQLVNTIGMVYVFTVIPYEIYRAYSREDSLRFGDEFAGTTIVESQMDFSNLVSR